MHKESIHGNLVATRYCGVLIIGPPNSGKSMLSYCLIHQHHFSLVADDLVVLTKNSGFPIVGSLYNLNFLGYLHLREKGVVYVNHTQKEAQITHIVCLKNDNKSHQHVTIFGQKIAAKALNIQEKTYQQCADLFINNSLDFCILST